MRRGCSTTATRGGTRASGWRFPSPRALTDITVTSCEPAAAGALRWEMEGADGGWHVLATTHREDLAPDRTTPFTLETRVVTSAVRVRAEAEVTLRQVELFDLG